RIERIVGSVERQVKRDQCSQGGSGRCVALACLLQCLDGLVKSIAMLAQKRDAVESARLALGDLLRSQWPGCQRAWFVFQGILGCPIVCETKYETHSRQKEHEGRAHLPDFL